MGLDLADDPGVGPGGLQVGEVLTDQPRLDVGDVGQEFLDGAFAQAALGRKVAAQRGQLMVLCPRIVYTDLNSLICKIWFPSPACDA
jgi:hypothetical protein